MIHHQAHSEKPIFVWPVIIVVAAMGVWMFVSATTTGSPPPLVGWFGLVGLVVVGPGIVVLLRLTNDRGFMGEHTNGWLVNATLVFAAVTSLYLGYESILETFQ